jgi:hypothetical protein
MSISLSLPKFTDNITLTPIPNPGTQCPARRIHHTLQLQQIGCLRLPIQAACMAGTDW